MLGYFKSILFIILVFCVFSCSLVPNELKIAEELIETRPDSALSILQDLSPEKYASDENRALYEMLLVSALDKNMLPLQPDSLLDYSIQYYELHPVKDNLATCYFYKGRMLKYGFHYEEAMRFYLKAADIMKEKENESLSARIMFDMGDIFLYQHEFPNARQKYQSAYNLFIKNDMQTFAYNTLVNIGKTYSQANDYKRAQPFFYKVSREAKDSLVKGLALQHLGINFFNLQQYDSAYSFLSESLHYPRVKNNHAIRCYYIADLMQDLNEVDSSYYYANRAINSDADIRTERECYRILVNAANAKGNLSDLKKYMAKYQDCSDSIRKIDAQTKGSYIETVYNSQKQVVEANAKMGYLIVLILLVVLLSVILYYFIRKRNMNERELADRIHNQQRVDMHKDVLFNHREVLHAKIEERKQLQTIANN